MSVCVSVRPSVRTRYLAAMKRVIDGNFIFQQYSALILIAFNSVQLLPCKTPIPFHSGQNLQNGPELNSDDDEI